MNREELPLFALIAVGIVLMVAGLFGMRAKPPAPITITVRVDRPEDVKPTIKQLLPALEDIRR